MSSYKHDQFIDMIDKDIGKIDSVLSESLEETILEDLHRELDGKYQSVVLNWGVGMYGWGKEFGFSIDFLDEASYVHNLKLMKAKLTTYIYGKNAITDVKTGITINNVINNDIKIQAIFERARNEINDMPGLTYDETKEIIEKIDEIQKIVNSEENKKKKWELLKPIAKWSLDKSVDVAISLLPLLLQIH